MSAEVPVSFRWSDGERHSWHMSLTGEETGAVNMVGDAQNSGATLSILSVSSSLGVCSFVCLFESRSYSIALPAWNLCKPG